MEGSGAPKGAPWISIPEGDITAVEHPCFIKHDVERAIAMIGGGTAISDAMREGSDRTFALSFRPDEPTTRTIIAHRKRASNILLQIHVPKRTGRKRKRGSVDPWQTDESEASRRDAAYLVRSMQDSPTSYRVNAIGPITDTHLWRSMPDFAYSTQHIQSIQDVKSTLLTQSYPTIKDFKMPVTHGLEDTTTLPPAVWSQVAIPQTYTYRQNPSVKVVSDPTTGQVSVHNTQAPPKVYSYQMQWDDPDYPSAPDPRLAPLTDQAQLFQDVTGKLQKLFEKRPIWTRRALLNVLQAEISSFNVVRFCLAYVAYAMRSGPWRDTYIRMGVDPRTDKSCRIFQTIMLQLVPKETQAMRSAIYRKHTTKPRGTQAGSKDSQAIATDPVVADKVAGLQKVAEERKTYARFWARSNDVRSHIFDGVTTLPKDGKIWQLCDITDPQIVCLRDLPEEKLRPTCETRYFGWYHNGTCAKMRIILKAKADALQKGKVIDTGLIEPLIHLPEDVFVLVEQPGELTPEMTVPTTPAAMSEPQQEEQLPQQRHVQEQEQGPESEIEPRILITDMNIGQIEMNSIPEKQARPAETPPPSTVPAVPSMTAATLEQPTEQSGTVTLTHDMMVAMMDPPLTREQYSWLGFYRAYSRTEAGQKPSIGVPATLPSIASSKPYSSRAAKRAPREFRRKDSNPAKKRGRKTTTASNGDGQTAQPEQDSPGPVTTQGRAEGAELDGYDLDEGDDGVPAELDPNVMPSIEFNGFDDEDDDDDDDELGMDADPEIKLEPEDEEAWLAGGTREAHSIVDGSRDDPDDFNA